MSSGFVGTDGVVNRCNTTIGIATLVFALPTNAVGGLGEVTLYGTPGNLLLEDGSFLLFENGDKIAIFAY
jgi:hypothetical protein